MSADDPRWLALSQIESGDCDTCIGPDGEVSRFQILPNLWLKYSHLPLWAARNPFTALHVAELIMGEREMALMRIQKCPPTDLEFYLLWHRPAVLLTSGIHTLSSSDADRMMRFENLTEYFSSTFSK